MADGFRIPFQEAESEFVEKRSRFISHVWRVETEEEAQARIQETKKKYYDARHNCWCYLLGPNLVRYSDDGEPQGTSGAPMVKMLTAAGITDAVIVVTRYFGGIKLGTGGLARAYTSTAKLGLEAAGICCVESKLRLTCRFDYTYLDKLRNLAGEVFSIGDVRYTDKVEGDIICEPEDEEETKAILKNVTSGRMTIEGADILQIKEKILK